MGTAVERLELWTAFALLVVALFVGAAGTLAWVNETPERAARTGSDASAAPGDAVAQSVSAVSELLARLAYKTHAAGSRARNAIGHLPGGPGGVLLALLAGAVGLPLLAAGARATRLAAGSAKRLRTVSLPRRAPIITRRQRSRTARSAPFDPGTAMPAQLPVPGMPDAQAHATQTTAGAPAQYAAEARSGMPPADPTAPETTAAVETNFVRLAPARRAPPAACDDVFPAAGQETRTAVEPPSVPARATSITPLPVADTPGYAEAYAASDEDRAMAAMERVSAVLAGCGATNQLLAADVAGDEALVILDPRPEDEATIGRVFAAQPVTSSHAQLRWNAPIMQVRFAGATAVAAGSTAMAIPLLVLGRRRVRFVPLASWRHLGIYGGGAHVAAHHVITTLLCQRRPDELGLAVLDRHGWASLYRHVPHWVEPPGDGPATADAVSRALRCGGATAHRPVLVVLVDPDGATLSAFSVLLSRLSLQPAAPVHIMVVQRRLQQLGRQLYLTLAGLVTAGEAAPELLPAVRRWPRRGNAVVLVRGQRWAGRPFETDEAAVGELARRMAQYPRASVPVLWQACEPLLDYPAPVGSTGS